MRKIWLFSFTFVFACGGVSFAQASSFEPSGYEKGSDPIDQDIKHKKIVNVAIGGTSTGSAAVPTVANLYAMITKKRRSLLDGVGVFSAVFLSGMTVGIGGTGGFFESATSKHYVYSMLPVWGTSIALMGLGVSNLVLIKKDQKDQKPKLKKASAEPQAQEKGSSAMLVGEFQM